MSELEERRLEHEKRHAKMINLIQRVLVYKASGIENSEIAEACNVPESTVLCILKTYNELLDDYAKALAAEFVFGKEENDV